ncbi:CapA family protein [Nocardioides pacificus]
MQGRRAVLVPGLAALVLLAGVACTSGSGETPAETPRAEPAAESSPSSAPAPGSPAEPPSQPLVLAVDPRRGPVDVSLRQARRLIRDRDVAGLPARAVEVMAAADVGPHVRVVRVDGVHPLRAPRRYPLTVPAGTDGQPRVTTVTVVGDVMLGRGVADRSSSPAAALRPMRRRLASASLTVGNLENTLSRAGAPTQGGDSFAADPRVAKGLRAAGFDALSLANNHLGDFGPQALVETVRRLRAAGLRTFGAGRDAAQAWQPVVVERKGVRFGLIGFNAIGETPEVGPDTPGAVSVSMPPRTGPLDRAELDRFLRAVRRLDRDVDVTMVLPHWGTQYTQRPEPIQRRVARDLVDAGADVVVGGHPHWVQGASLLKRPEGGAEALVVHSLGNFAFDMDFMQETQEGLVLELVFWDDELKAAELVPYRIGDDYAPREVAWADAADNLALFWEFSDLAATPR